MPIGPGIDVISAVQAWWAGTPAMAALCSDGRLWHKVAPEDTQLPYATVFLVSEVNETWTTAYPFKRVSIQLNLHADTDFQARTMGLAVRGSLGASAAGQAGAPLVIGESPVCHCLPDGDGVDVGEGLGPDGRDCWVAFETFDLAFTP